MAQIFALASTAFSVVGSIVGGNRAEQASRYNARQLDEQADATLRASGEREHMMRRRSAEQFSAQRVAMLQNGVDASTGTALIGAGQQYQDADLDALQVRYEGLMQARGMRAQAKLERWEGKAKKRQAYLSAAGSLLGATGSYLGGKQDPSKVPVEDRSIRPFGGYGGRY